MKLVIVDDNKQFRESLSFFAEVKLGYTVTASFENPLPLFEPHNLVNNDIILMDIEMPEMNGILATKKILVIQHTLKIIAITNHQEKAYLEDLIRAGFKGCVFKNNIYNELDKALKTIYKKKLFFPSNINI